MRNSTLIAGIIVVLLLLGGVVVFTLGGNAAVSGVTYDESQLVGDVRQGLGNVLVMQDGEIVGPINTASSTIGASGTSLAGIVAGTCTIWSASATISASSSQQVECQSATNGTLSTVLRGVTTDSVCSLAAPPGASTQSGGLVVNGYVASSTDAGSFTVRVSNQTGGAFTWSSTASSSWKYWCGDPA